jgi:hypothetical protein
MSVFISYSHADQAFVDTLSLRLLNDNVKVWRDEYKLLAGDSLTVRIGVAIEQAGFLCVVISDGALASTWVDREIRAGLLREIESHRIIIIPLLLKDVAIPESLRDRLWIDCRQDIEAGITKLLTVVRAKGAADSLAGTTEDARYFFYYGTEGGWVEGRYDLALDVVSLDREERFCLITHCQFRGNEAATEDGLRKRELSSFKAYILRACARAFESDPARLQVRPDKPGRANFCIASEDGELRFDARAEVKMLGAHRGETVVFNIGALFAQISIASGLETDKQ